MNSLRKIIQESIQIAENLQLADKVYFAPGKLSPRVREIILKITGGDPYTKIITDIYYAQMLAWKKLGHWAVTALDGNDDEEPEEKDYHTSGKDDVMHLEDWQKLKAMHSQIKMYNRNVFPIKGFNINNPGDILELIRALKERASILEMIKKMPSIAIRNMKDDIRTERSAGELQRYRSDLDHFLSYYSLIGNRDAKFRKVIEQKMFKSGVTLDELLDFVQDKENLLGGKPFTKNSIKSLVRANSYDMEIVYDKGNVMVIDVTSAEAIKKIGCNSFWCFTYGTAYQQASTNWPKYSTNDHVYVIVDFSESSDSTEFMHVLIEPLDYSPQPEDSEEDVNDRKLFDMSNEEVYGALHTIDQLIGLEEAPFILHFDEPVNVKGPSSKWPYEDPNQLKLDLKEIRALIRKRFLEEAKKYLIL